MPVLLPVLKSSSQSKGHIVIEFLRFMMIKSCYRYDVVVTICNIILVAKELTITELTISPTYCTKIAQINDENGNYFKRQEFCTGV